ncbi:MAG TPA: glycosyltransferase family A protein [Candidatus Paceibacterota bacterium]
MYLSLVMAYYDNPTMLRKQYETIAEYSNATKDAMEYIVVDDGSPRWPARDVPRPEGLPKFSLFRIKKDVPWNQDAARNIGVHHSLGKWLLLTDMDHLVPLETMQHIMLVKLNKKIAYTFQRMTLPGWTPYKDHPNSWLMRRSLYEEVGGYDESLAGYYGTDGEFRTRLMKRAPIASLLRPIIRVPREVIPDASTTTYQRKNPADKVAIGAIIAQRAFNPKWRPKRLSFKYERVV